MSPTSFNNRILFVLPAFYRNGAVDLVVNLSEELTKLDRSVEILAINQQSSYANLPNESVTVTIPLRENQSPQKNLLTYLNQLIKSVSQADIVFLPWENGPAFTYPSLIARMLGKPTVAIVQNNIQKTSVDYPSVIAPHLIRWAYWQTKAVVCVSQGLKKIVASELHLNPKKAISISNGMNLEAIRAKAKQPCEIEFERNDLPFMVAIGRLASQKGFDLLIESHAAVIKRGIAHRLVIIGEGAEFAALSDLAERLGISRSVTFLGFVENPLPILVKASLFCLSSRYEGLPLSLIEAAILGIPTVATDCPTGPREILADGLYGDLVTTESVAALTNAIANYLQSPETLIEKAKASAENAERLSMRNCAEKYIRLIDDLTF